jgi:transcriptional regulator with XRE-family HTH domain
MPQGTPKIGPAILKARKSQKLTLEQLAARSGVSKSMLSQIERSEANPTFAVVWSLTLALGIEFSDLVSASDPAERSDQIEITTRTNTPEIRSVDGLCRLKILSSPKMVGHFEWYDIAFEPGGKLESRPHAPGTFEHFTAFGEGFRVTCGQETSSIHEGETARYAADQPHCIENSGSATARGLLVVLYR